MVPLSTPVILPFVGNDTTSAFAITFPVFEEANVVAKVVDTTDPDHPETTLVLNVDYTLANIGRPNTNGTFTLVDAGTLPPGWMPGDPVPVSQDWINAGKLKTGWDIIIKFTDEAWQPSKFRNLGNQSPEAFERGLDRLTMNILALRQKVEASLQFTDFESATLSPNTSAQDLLDRVTALENELNAFLAAGGGLPPGVQDGQFLEGDTTDPLKAVWKDGAYDGISALTGAQFTSTGLKDTLDKIIRITYTPPLISLAVSPAQSVREKGTVIASVDMNVTTTKKSNDIGAVRYYRNGVLVQTHASPNPAGGAEPTYTDSTSFSDTMTFYAQVDDILSGGNGPTTVQSSTVTFPFVYPYYYGAGVPGKTPAQVAALTKSVIASTATLPETFTLTAGDVMYFAYPASYGNLTSILDPNSFETLSSWTKTVANITGLDGNAVSYNIYAFNNPAGAGATVTYTFKR